MAFKQCGRLGHLPSLTSSLLLNTTQEVVLRRLVILQSHSVILQGTLVGHLVSHVKRPHINTYDKFKLFFRKRFFDPAVIVKVDTFSEKQVTHFLLLIR